MTELLMGLQQAPAQLKPPTRGIVTRRQLEAIEKATQVVTAASQSRYATLLAVHDISPAFVDQLEYDLALCHARITRAEELSRDVDLAEESERIAQQELINLLKEISTAARQKYSHSVPRQLAECYFVVETFEADHERVIQLADRFQEQLRADLLPGITAEKISVLRRLRDNCVSAHVARVDARFRAHAEQIVVETAINGITNGRFLIQFAAEAQWPPHQPANATIRREFLLPADRPFYG